MTHPRSHAPSLLLAAIVLSSLSPLDAPAQEGTRGDRPTGDNVGDLGSAVQEIGEKKERVRGIPRLTQALARLPPFLRDTELSFLARTYYWYENRVDESIVESWAIGGALVYRSGWILEAFRVGAALYTSQPLYAPDDRGGSGLLLPDQSGYTIPGQAYLEMRYGDHDLTLYRQAVELPYVNSADSRMTPNTFEAYLARGKMSELKRLGEIDYVVGWIDRIRRRAEDNFEKMSRAAGVPGGDDGMANATVRIRPRENLYFGITNQAVPNAYNTLYGEGSYFGKLSDAWGLRVDGQFTYQASLGSGLEDAPFDTWHGALRLAASYGGAIFTLAASATSDAAAIRKPYGFSPAYLALMQSDFDRPGEEAWLVGISYDFENAGLPGLSGFVNFAQGFDARDDRSTDSFANQWEADLTFDYRFQKGWFKGLWLRVRGSIRALEDAPRRSNQIRLILNYDLPIL